MDAIDRFFQISERNSTTAREVRGAFATFLTMAYILFANPRILTDGGVPLPVATIATAAAAGICCILMGLVANFPLALASGMGLNIVVAFQVIKEAGSWQAAMGLVVLDGVLTLALVLAGFREAVMNAIPRDLRLAIGGGIGVFIAFIGLVSAKLVVLGNAAAPVAPGSLRDRATLVAAIGLLITAILVARKVTGALIIGILATTLLAYVTRTHQFPRDFAWPELRNLRFVADIRGALRWNLVPLLFALIMVDFFDTLGTASAIAEEAELSDERGRIPGIRRILAIDSLSAAIGGALGASSVTSYIESAAGVAEGARTGLHTVIVGILFLLAIVITPLMGAVPGFATAPALIIVGVLMVSQVGKIHFDDYETSIPAFLTLLAIPMTYSIAHGIGFGFISYCVIKLAKGKWREVHVLMYVTAAAFTAWFAWGHA
jgi:AGZA family xanthine/uracil permease-like MFS transporter